MVINRVNICYGDNDDKNNIDIEWGINWIIHVKDGQGINNI